MAYSRRGHNNHDHARHDERWLVTYADLITLLLVFFIVLYAMSQIEEEKFIQIRTSLRQAFNVEVLKEDASFNSGLTLQTDTRLNSYLQLRGKVQAILARLNINPDSADVELTDEGIVIHLEDSLLFAPGQVQLRPDAIKVLDGLGEVFRSLTNPIRIEGHTDNIPPPDSTFPDNWELSVMRAVSAVRYLTDVQGLDAERFSAVGYGEFHPRADNATFEGRRKNRRVDFVIIDPEAPRTRQFDPIFPSD